MSRMNSVDHFFDIAEVVDMDPTGPNYSHLNSVLVNRHGESASEYSPHELSQQPQVHYSQHHQQEHRLESHPTHHQQEHRLEPHAQQHGQHGQLLQHQHPAQYHLTHNSLAHRQPSLQLMTTQVPGYNNPAVANSANQWRDSSATVHMNHMTLAVRQDPKEGLVVLDGKEKCRKPIDPPPIVQLHVSPEVDQPQQFLQNPYYWAMTTLIDADTHELVTSEDRRPVLLGATTSSLHRLKDIDNKDGGFFVFGDISCTKTGRFKLKFSMFEMRALRSGQPYHQAHFVKEAISEAFSVVNQKEWKGLQESTYLSRAFSDQGCRLRLRKEARNPPKNTKRSHEDYQDEPVHAGPVQQPNGHHSMYVNGSDAPSSVHHSPEQKRLKRSYDDHSTGGYDHYNNEHANWRQPQSFQSSYHRNSSFDGPPNVSSVGLAVAPVTIPGTLVSSMNGNVSGTLPVPSNSILQGYHAGTY